MISPVCILILLFIALIAFFCVFGSSKAAFLTVFGCSVFLQYLDSMVPAPSFVKSRRFVLCHRLPLHFLYCTALIQSSNDFFGTRNSFPTLITRNGECFVTGIYLPYSIYCTFCLIASSRCAAHSSGVRAPNVRLGVSFNITSAVATSATTSQHFAKLSAFAKLFRSSF